MARKVAIEANRDPDRSLFASIVQKNGRWLHGVNQQAFIGNEHLGGAPDIRLRSSFSQLSSRLLSGLISGTIRLWIKDPLKYWYDPIFGE